MLGILHHIKTTGGKDLTQIISSQLEILIVNIKIFFDTDYIRSATDRRFLQHFARILESWRQLGNVKKIWEKRVETHSSVYFKLWHKFWIAWIKFLLNDLEYTIIEQLNFCEMKWSFLQCKRFALDEGTKHIEPNCHFIDIHFTWDLVQDRNNYA